MKVHRVPFVRRTRVFMVFMIYSLLQGFGRPQRPHIRSWIWVFACVILACLAFIVRKVLQSCSFHWQCPFFPPNTSLHFEISSGSMTGCQGEMTLNNISKVKSQELLSPSLSGCDFFWQSISDFRCKQHSQAEEELCHFFTMAVMAENKARRQSVNEEEKRPQSPW